MPPIVVFQYAERFILADGFHRVAAARMNGCQKILAEIRQGTQADALRYALSANLDRLLDLYGSLVEGATPAVVG